MKNRFLLPLILLFSACASTPPAEKPNVISESSASIDVVMFAMSLAETPYRYGGNSVETGFDCSSFVGHVYKNSIGIELPRSSQEISQVGQALARAQLQSGDLVFFNTQHRANSHVGIYVGEGKFVHAPRTGARIRVENMEANYWLSRYNGARRITF
jgi:cell wall-associated NlpC family hydrolase